jgi:hypothetical protein
MDRKLIISVKNPCKLENYLVPNELTWNEMIPNYSDLSKYEFFIHYDYLFVNYKLPTIDFTQFKPDIDVIIIRTGFNLIKHLTLNKNHHKKIESLGYSVQEFNIESQLFYWYRKLFKLNDRLQDKYNQMLAESKPLGNNVSKLICIQARFGIKNLDTKFMPQSDSQLYWQFILNKFNLNDDKSKIFITTDRQEVIDEAMQAFGREKVIAFKDRSFHIAHRKTIRDESECDKISELYLDFLLLSECNMGIISQSGFGMIGILNRKDKTDLDNFYAYTNPKRLKINYSDRRKLGFFQFNSSFIYLEFGFTFEKLPFNIFMRYWPHYI